MLGPIGAGVLGPIGAGVLGPIGAGTVGRTGADAICGPACSSGGSGGCICAGADSQNAHRASHVPVITVFTRQLASTMNNTAALLVRSPPWNGRIGVSKYGFKNRRMNT